MQHDVTSVWYWPESLLPGTANQLPKPSPKNQPLGGDKGCPGHTAVCLAVVAVLCHASLHGIVPYVNFLSIVWYCIVSAPRW